MAPFLIICFTAMACSLVRDDANDMLRDWNDEVYQELARAIEKELKHTKVVKMHEKGQFRCLIF
jgi:hypothetical protein